MRVSTFIRFLVFCSATSGLLGCGSGGSPHLQEPEASLQHSSSRSSREVLSARGPLTSQVLSKSELLALRKVVVLPLEIARDAEELLQNREFAERLLQEYATGELLVESVSGSDVQMSLNRLDLKGERLIPKQRQALMADFGADGVLETQVLRYSDRIGSSIGSDRPAAVGVQFQLFRSGRDPVWMATYHFSDTALSEDLLSARKRFSSETGAGWRGAKGLFEESLKLALSALEAERRSTFGVQ